MLICQFEFRIYLSFELEIVGTFLTRESNCAQLLCIKGSKKTILTKTNSSILVYFKILGCLFFGENYLKKKDIRVCV